MRTGRPARPVIDRLMDNVEVDVETGCWLWAARIGRGGYAQISMPTGGPRTATSLAHRVSFEAFNGEIPAGLVLDHLCRVRHCINPEHLEAVTSSLNTRRGLNGQVSHCPQGHNYDEENTMIYRGWRVCRECQRESSRRWRSRVTA